MRGFRIYTSEYCGYCTRAKRILDDKGITYTEIEVTRDNVEDLSKMVAEAKGIRVTKLHLTVPQIFFDGFLIGGHDDLVKWIKSYEEPAAEPRDIVDLPTARSGGYKGYNLPDMMPLVAPFLPLDDDD